MKFNERSVLFAYRREPPPETFGHFIESTHALLRKLQAAHPVFRDGLAMWTSTPKTIPLAPDLSNLRELMLERAWDRKAPDAISKLDDKGRPTEDSTSQLGFGCVFGHAIPKVAGDMHISLYSIPDNNYAAGGVSIYFPKTGFTEFGDCDFVKSLLRLCVEHVDPDIAGVDRQDVTAAAVALAEPLAQDEWLPASWLSYYANPRVAEVLPPGETVERFGSGGVLITVQKQQPTPQDRQALEHIARLRLALQRGGFSTRESLKRLAG